MEAKKLKALFKEYPELKEMPNVLTLVKSDLYDPELEWDVLSLKQQIDISYAWGLDGGSWEPDPDDKDPEQIKDAYEMGLADRNT